MSSQHSGGNSDSLVAQLNDPWSRRAARRKLVATKAVEPLLGCLSSTNESVVWSAVESLGELRAKEAIGPLIDLLERGVLTLDVSEALQAITGQDLGGDVRRWRAWLDASGGEPSGDFDTLDCVKRTAEYLGVEPSGSEETFSFKLSLPKDRSQKVVVFFGRSDDDGEKLVLIYSECGPANPKHYETVLRKNLTIPAGAFAIRDVRGEARFVMVETMFADTLTPGTLAKRIENIAARADMVEKALTKEDRH